nr:cytochrome p450 CYP3043A1 [Brachionus angularis]
MFSKIDLNSKNIQLALFAFALGLISYAGLKKLLKNSGYKYPKEIEYKNKRLGSDKNEFLSNLQNNHEQYLDILKQEYPNECTLSVGSKYFGTKQTIVFLNSIESVKKFSKSGNQPEPIPDKPKSFLLNFISKGYLGSFFRMFDDKLLEIRKSSLAGLHKLTSDPNFESKLEDELLQFFEYFNHEYIDSKKLFEKEALEKLCTVHLGKEDGLVQNAPVYFQQLTTNMITMIGLGARFDYDTNPESDIKKQINNISEALNSLNLPNIIKFGKLDAYFKKDTLIYLASRVNSVYDFLLNAITGYKKLSYESDFIRTFADFVISKQQQKLNSQKGIKDEDNYSDKDILVQVFTLLMAGTCTTGFTLSWAFYYLSKNQKVQNQIYDEIVKNVGNNGLIRSKMRVNLPFTEACINEILRLSSTQALIPRSTRNNVQIENYKLAKDTTVLINTYSIHRDEKYWSNSKELEPLNWFDENKNLKSFHESFIPFGISPRSCLGDNLSREILFLIIANFVQRFQFFYIGDPHHEYNKTSGKLGVMRRPYNYHLKITRRE